MKSGKNFKLNKTNVINPSIEMKSRRNSLPVFQSFNLIKKG